MHKEFKRTNTVNSMFLLHSASNWGLQSLKRTNSVWYFRLTNTAGRLDYICHRRTEGKWIRARDEYCVPGFIESLTFTDSMDQSKDIAMAFLLVCQNPLMCALFCALSKWHVVWPVKLLYSNDFSLLCCETASHHSDCSLVNAALLISYFSLSKVLNCIHFWSGSHITSVSYTEV